MYPKNAASPPEVDLGQILQLSDGAIQTTGASVRVKIGTGAWGAGAGTLSCDTTSGIWTYLPTQAETNAAYFIIGVYKASCTALSKTVVTSISATAGYAGLDWANILSPTTTVNLSGTTVKTATDVETDTQDIQSRLPAALVSGRIDASVGAMATDTITSTALAANAVTEIQSGLATSAQATAIEADTQDIQSRLPAALVGGRMDSSVGAMAANTITASAVASDAVTEIQSGLATSTIVTAGFTEIKGATWSSATDTLEAIRDASGGGGSTSIMVTPVVAQVPVRVIGSNIETFIGDLSDIRVGVFSGTDPVDLSTMGDLEVCVQLKSGVDLDLVPMADITIDGDDNNYFSWTPNGESVDAVRTGKWSLRKASNKQVIAYGAWIVVDAALSDAS